MILIPTVAAVLLGGLRIASSVQSAVDYARAHHLAELGGKITGLTHALADERGAVVTYIATGRGENLVRVEQQQQVVDQMIAIVGDLAEPIDESYGSLVNRNVETVQYRLDRLPALRRIALESKLPAMAAIDKYSSIIADLIALTETIAEGSSDRKLAENVRTFVALSRAKEQAAQQRAVLSAALHSGTFSQSEFDDLVAAGARLDSAIATFRSLASVQTRQLYEDTVTGVKIDDAERLLLRATSHGPGSDLGIDADEWHQVATFKVNRLRDVEVRLVNALVKQSGDLGAMARRNVLIDSLVVAALLALVLVATSVVARSMVLPLQALRSGALDVAGRRLPAVVTRLRESPDERPVIEPVSVGSSDEIGEVAQAFDEVHREAARLAAEEAQLRGTVSAMFVNLSRRSQTLVERQLQLIDNLEHGEQDPDRLASLFRLDHLATRMRRNGENLLVLSGQEPPRRWSQPVPLVDVLRASLSEVEQYDRVRLRVQSGIAVSGWAVNDLVHLVAELLDNATSFSPPDTTVMVTGQALTDGHGKVEIEDVGIGMTPAALIEGNERLARPPVVDVSVSRRMGLFVVGRLASRHSIRVELRHSRGGGVTAQVLLPADVLTRSSDAHASPVDMPLAPEPESAVPDLPRVTQRSTTGPLRPSPPLGPPSAPSPGPPSAPVPAPSPGPPSAPVPIPSQAGPPTSIDPPPDADRETEALPIFAAIESEWFQRRNRRSPFQARVPEANGPADDSSPEEESSAWSSPADAGWRAAEAVEAPAAGGTTTAGLPKRVPGANLVPGSVDSAEAATPARPAVRSATTVRDRLAGFRRGVSEGRAAGSTGGTGDEAGSQMRDDWENTWAR